MTDFNGEQYKRVMAACKERDKIPTQAWTPDEDKLILNDIDFTKDSEYVKLFGQQSELIEQWVEKEEKKRPPPMPPMTPFEGV